MTAPRKRVALRLLLVPVAGLGLAHGTARAAGGLEARVRSAQAAIRSDLDAMVAARDRLLARLSEKTGRGPPSSLVRLELEGVLRGHALSVELVHDGRAWRPGSAAAPGWNGALHEADGSALRISADSVEGTLRVRLNWDRVVPRDGRAIDCVFSMDARIRDRRVRGEASTPGAPGAPGNPPVPPARGAVTGTVEARSRPEAPGLEEMSLEVVAGPCEEAKWLESNAERVYQQARAAVISGRSLVPYDAALALAPPLLLVRPTFRKGDEEPALIDATDIGLEFDDPVEEAAPDVDLAPALEEAERIRARVSRMRGIVERAAAAGGDAAFTVGSTDTGDPDFGPWYGSPALAHSDDSPNALPPDAGAPAADGEQEWRHVGAWRILGPFERTSWEADTPLLPEIVEALGAKCVIDERGLGHRYRGGAEAGWQAPDVEPGTGRVTPPIWTRAKHPNKWFHAGLLHGSFYAFAEVTSVTERELWVAVGVNDRGKLWVDDTLVWRSPSRKDPWSEEEHSLFRARFRKGRNRLLFRCDNDSGRTFFNVRVCTRGRPRDAATVRRRTAAVEAARRKLAGPGARTRGWRGDRTGRYPEARPVTAWDISRGVNVLWRVPMSWCNSTPVVAGDRIFTQEEPHTLVCVGKSDGEVLWRRSSNVLELVSRDAFEESERLFRAMQKAAGRAARPEDAEGDTVESLQAEGLTDEEIQKRLRGQQRAARKSEREFWRLLKKHAGVGAPIWGDFMGHAFPTPVTDGEHVCVKYGTGVAACYDVKGDRRWMVRTRGATREIALCPSPVLVAGKLVMELPAREFLERKPRKGEAVMVALDAATGGRLWVCEPFVHASGSASPVVVRLTNGREEMDVIASGGGALVRADDGKLLIENMGAACGNGTPVAVGDVLYYSADCLKTAVKLVMVSRDRVGARPLWTRYLGGEFSAGLVHHEGLLYGLVGGQTAGDLDAVDAATGELVKALPGVMPNPGRAYVPPALGGRFIFTADDGRMFAWYRTVPGTMTVVDPGRDPRVVARNFMEGLHAAPVFDGDRFFVRTRESLMCLGYTGGEGRAYEAEVNARTILEQVYPARPEPAEAVEIALGVRDVKGRAPERFPWGRLTDGWLFAGPFPAGAAEDLRAKLVRRPMRPRPEKGTPVSGGGVSREFARLDPRRFVQNDWFYAPVVDVAGPVGSKPETVTYYHAVVENDWPRTVRLELAAPEGSRAWLEGVEVAHGARLRLEPGYCSFLVEVRLGRVPPAGPRKTRLPPRLVGKRYEAPEVPESHATMIARFWPSDNEARELEEWLAFLRRYRDILERAARLSPASDAGRRAKALLGEVR